MAMTYENTIDALNVASTVTLPEMQDQSLVIVRTRDNLVRKQIESVKPLVDSDGRPYVEIWLED